MYELKSVLFDMSLYNINMGRIWLRRHNIPFQLPDKTDKFYRFRINKKEYKSTYTYNVSTGVSIVVGLVIL
jgi:hypothetical protein